MNSTIPHEAEEIHIHIELPTGKRVWWPATVEDVTPCEDKDGIIAYAAVVFHAAFQYPVERCNAEILASHTIRTAVSYTHLTLPTTSRV